MRFYTGYTRFYQHQDFMRFYQPKDYMRLHTRVIRGSISSRVILDSTQALYGALHKNYEVLREGYMRCYTGVI